MALDLPVIPLNVGASAQAAPIRQPADLTPAIAKMMDAYKQGFVSTQDMIKHGMISGDTAGKAAGGVASSLQDIHDDEIIRALQNRGAIGSPVSGASEGSQTGAFDTTPPVTGAGLGGIAGGIM